MVNVAFAPEEAEYLVGLAEGALSIAVDQKKYGDGKFDNC
jgi:hypothetical protein